MNRNSKYTPRHPYAAALAAAWMLIATACENRALSLDDLCPTGRPLVRVSFLWDENAAPPERMYVLWFDGDGKLVLPADYDSFKSTIEPDLPADRYKPLSIDLMSFENETLEFWGSRTSRDAFEVRNASIAAAWYTNTTDIPKLQPNETLISEANPYVLYLDAWNDDNGNAREVDTRGLSANDTVDVQFAPVNVLHEFTFLIHGVRGLQYAGAGRAGVISGQAASYFPASGNKSTQPTSLIFSRMTLYTNGQNYKWNDEEKELFTAFDPTWNDAETGWTDDWITGKFTSFGPADLENGPFRLTLGILNTYATQLYIGVWGYPEPDDKVNNIREQITGAWGGVNGTGLLSDQLKWREGNGGYDIILSGHGGLVITSPGTPDSGGGGGFVVDSDDWGEDVIVR